MSVRESVPHHHRTATTTTTNRRYAHTMIIYGVSAQDTDSMIARVSRERYDSNVGVRRCEDWSGPRRGPAVALTLRVFDSYGPGARSSAMQSGHGPQGGRATPAACWHAHYDILDTLTSYVEGQGYTPRVRSALYRSDSREEWRARALESARRNVGSPMVPMTMPECCECWHAPYLDMGADDIPERANDVFREPLPRPEPVSAGPSMDAMRPDTAVPYPFGVEDTLKRIDTVVGESP